jgi:hypothetical protein
MSRRELTRRGGFLLVASVSAALSSCIPTKEPLSDALKSETDNDLIGTWVMEKDDQIRFMVIGRHEHAPDEADQALPRGLMAYRQFTLTKDGKLGPGAGGGVFFVSRIKGERYANVFGDDAVQEAQKQGTWGYATDTRFYLVRYRVEKNTLTFVSPDSDRVKAAINKGAIKGTIRDDDVEMAGGTALADFLAKEGSKSLFTEESAEKWQRAKVVPLK